VIIRTGRASVIDKGGKTCLAAAPGLTQFNNLREWHAHCNRNQREEDKMYIPIGLLLLVILLLIFVF
jgi:hypothetical protein